MAFLVSPGIQVREFDLTTVVPAVATTEGAIAGAFSWGPVEERVLISNEKDLVNKFGEPTESNFETFFTAASFLAYGNQLYVSRAVDSTAFNATANVGVVANTLVRNDDHYESLTFGDTDLLYIAKYPGSRGNDLQISVCDSADAYSNNHTNSDSDTSVALKITAGSNTANLDISNNVDGFGTANSEMVTIKGKLNVGDLLEVGNTTLGTQFLRIENIGDATRIGSSNTYTATIRLSEKVALIQDITMDTVKRRWGFFNLFDAAPGTSDYVADRHSAGEAARDEMHVVVLDEDGGITGQKRTVLETFSNLSRASDGKTADGSTNYYKTVLNNQSEWVWWANDRSGAASATATNIAASTNEDPLYLSFSQGAGEGDEGTISLGSLQTAADFFADPEKVDVSIMMQGKARGGTNGQAFANYLIDNVAEKRLDCVVTISPDRADVVGNRIDPTNDLTTFRNTLRASSYGIMDSGYKYMYDKYNDVFRYVPLNGDIAGLMVRTDNQREPWYSPAGFNRGEIKNVVKLAYNPDQAERDILYRSDINPVVKFRNQGNILFGDKTLLGKPSAFSRINVRRLFIVLEKAIATASKFTLFELNDEFTRAQFVSLVEPFLRTVQGRRGITDFRVVCDETNNTPEVIDRNEFVGDIYIKPARSINFIRLNFVAVRTGVAFEEVVGRFGG
ncbi:MAG: phage tail sheath C-terminal domain-containing protein [Candidatus Poseidoniales archaeon]